MFDLLHCEMVHGPPCLYLIDKYWMFMWKKLGRLSIAHIFFSKLFMRGG